MIEKGIYLDHNENKQICNKMVTTSDLKKNLWKNNVR